jgi:DNA polymerase IV
MSTDHTTSNPVSVSGAAIDNNVDNNKDHRVQAMLIDMNSYFASCEQQSNPALRGKPVAVVPMLGVPTTAVLAASYQAKKFGIKTGTMVGDCKKMCPDIRFVLAGHSSYIDYHDKIAEVIESIIPIDETLSIDEFGCRLTGTQQDPLQAQAIAREIKRAIESKVGE